MSHDFLNKNNIMLYLSVVLATLLLNLFTTSAPHGGSPSGSDIEEYRERERERERESMFQYMQLNALNQAAFI